MVQHPTVQQIRKYKGNADPGPPYRQSASEEEILTNQRRRYIQDRKEVVETGIFELVAGKQR